MTIQITTPVMPNANIKALIKEECQRVTGDKHLTFNIYEVGADFYGETNFKVMVLDYNNGEMLETQGKIMNAIFTMLFNLA